jgi:hypothetical protein
MKNKERKDSAETRRAQRDAEKLWRVTTVAAAFCGPVRQESLRPYLLGLHLGGRGIKELAAGERLAGNSS